MKFAEATKLEALPVLIWNTTQKELGTGEKAREARPGRSSRSLWLAFVPGRREVHRLGNDIASFCIQSWNGARDPNIKKIER